MLRRFRAARVVHAAIMAAALLALCGTVGLHPEPTSGWGGCARAGDVARLSSFGGDRDAAHVCLLCLVYGTAALVAAFAALVAALPALAVVPPHQQSWRGRLVFRRWDCRAPPATL